MRYAVLARFPRARATRWAHAARLFQADPETREFSALRTHISGEGAETGRDGRVERSGRVFLARGDSYLDAILSLNTAS